MPSAYWGKKAGGFWDPSVLKGTTGPQGFVIRLKRGGPGSGNSTLKRHHYTRLLVDNARAYGFINGVRIGGKTR